jgi:hypothetical protein
MSLLEAKRRQAKEVNSRRGKSIADVVRELQQDLVHSSYTNPPRRTAGAGPAGQKSVAAFSDRHVIECQGLFAKEEKKANVREIVRDIMAGVVPGRTRHNTTKAKGLSLGFMSSLQTPRRARMTGDSGLIQHLSRDLAKSAKDKQPGKMTQAGRQEEVKGEDLLAMALFGRHSVETVRLAVVYWGDVVRRERYERNRAAMQANLIWDDPERARMLMGARATLVGADHLSWFRIDTRNAKHKLSDVRSAFPLNAPPMLRSETCDDFNQLADAVKHQMNDMVVKQQERLTQQEREIMERWIVKERSKDIRKLKLADDEKMRHLEHTKRQLTQMPALFSLIERMYLTCIVRSVENAATFLSQIFSDTACLQIRIMVVPHLPVASRISDGRKSRK